MASEKVSKFTGVKKLLKYSSKYRGRLIGGIISGVLREVSIVAAVGIVAWMAAHIAKGNGFPDSRYMWFLIIAVAGRVVFSYLEMYWNHDVAFHILVDFRVLLYRSFVTICPDILLKHRSGQISTTLMNDVEILEWFYAHTIGIFVVDIVFLGGFVAFFWVLHWLLAILLLAAVCVIAIVPYILRKKADEQGKESRFRLGEANSVTLEGINGMNELLTLNSVDSYKKKNKKFMEALTDIQVQYAKRMGTEGGMLQAVSGIAAVIINLAAIGLVFGGSLSTEWFAVVGTIVWLVFGPFLELCNMARNFGLIFAASDRISGIIEAEPIIRDTGKETSTAADDSNVSFENVSYAYEGMSDYVLRDVSFTAERGKMIAIVGGSGAGKTTCTNLLCRMWDVNEGAIRIGGTDIRDLKVSALRKLISVVPQDVYLFNISMKDNIKLGYPEATDEEVRQAARMAMVDDFIESLPDGYDTIAGERGLQMSGGQRQRIAIARALLKDSPILVMDEAVSNLDTKTDSKIQQTIRNIAKDKTVIMVAHRLSTILEADELVVLKDGRVVQKGHHNELIARDGYYKELMSAQI